MNSWERITGPDLRVYRVLFAGVLLLMLPSFTWISRFPGSLYSPPPGPFGLLSGFPPHLVLVAITAGLAAAASALLVGVWVRTASWAATVLMTVGFGFSYSLGKIDHTTLLVLTPAVMAVAGWAPGARVRPWVLQLWAFTIGVAMATAAIPKLTASWLDPSTHAVRGLVAQQVLAYGQDTATANIAFHLTSPWLWEPIDWVAPLIEASIVVLALLGLRWFRVGLALLVFFHLGVMLTMNITFASSVVAYGAFVSWSGLPAAARLEEAVRRLSRRRLAVPGLAVAALLLAHFTDLASVVSPAVVIGGGVLVVWLVAREPLARRAERGGLRWSHRGVVGGQPSGR